MSPWATLGRALRATPRGGDGGRPADRPGAAYRGRVQHLSTAVAAVVRSMLEERGWSGRQLARESGINQASVARKLREESPFDLDDVQAITQALSVDLVDLMHAASRLLA